MSKRLFKYTVLKKIAVLLLLVLVITVFSHEVFARGGGAGGGGAGGGGHGGGNPSSYGSQSYLFYSEFFGGVTSINILYIACLFVTCLFFLYHLVRIIFFSLKKHYQIISIKKRIPSFHVGAFKNEVEKIFFTIQKTWMSGEIETCRSVVTESLFERFSIQLKFMNILQESNVLTNLKFDKFSITKFEILSHSIIVIVKIRALAKDSLMVQLDPNFNTNGSLDYFTEYWTFEANVNTVANSSLKWRLVTITQKSDYEIKAEEPESFTKNKVFISFKEHNRSFDRYQMEDYAVTLLFKGLYAQVKNDLAPISTLASTKFLEKLKKTFNPQMRFSYYRLYLNSSLLFDIKKDDSKFIFLYKVHFSFQRIMINETKKSLSRLDDFLEETFYIVELIQENHGWILHDANVMPNYKALI